MRRNKKKLKLKKLLETKYNCLIKNQLMYPLEPPLLILCFSF